MSSASVTTNDGQVIVSRDDDGPVPPAPPGRHATVVHVGGEGVYLQSDRPLDAGSFIAGLMLGMLLLFIVQTAMRWHARREAKGHARAAAIGPRHGEAKDHNRMAADVAALARRTATLETIVTDPAQRTAREIEALR